MNISKADLKDRCGRIIELLQEKTKLHRTQCFDKHLLFEEARSLPYYFIEYSSNSAIENNVYKELFRGGYILLGNRPNEIQLSSRGNRCNVWRP